MEYTLTFRADGGAHVPVPGLTREAAYQLAKVVGEQVVSVEDENGADVPFPSTAWEVSQVFNKYYSLPEKRAETRFNGKSGLVANVGVYQDTAEEGTLLSAVVVDATTFRGTSVSVFVNGVEWVAPTG